MSPHAFPPGFLWGVATAGHQNEGGNTGSDTWFAEHVTPSVFQEPSGRACDGYGRWREDVDRVAELGLTAYRFSVEWARLEPSQGSFSDEAFAHYAAIIERCHEHGLAPIVTYNHFTCPHWFAKLGGWLNPAAPQLFSRYCAEVTDRLGDRIAMAVTMNEPNLPRLLSWLGLPGFVAALERQTLAAASAAIDAIADGMSAGHTAARAAIKARRPELPVGFSLAVVDDQVVGDDASVRDRKRAQVYGRWLELARADEFIGVQNYERARYDASGPVPPPAGVPLNAMGSDVYPLSLAHAVQYAHEVSGVPVLVTEHGMSTPDDTLRAGFIAPALAALLEVIDGGVPVLGYCHWTLMDNFEWIFGYQQFLGLHSVDRQTLDRTAKPSAAVYSAIARANAVPAVPADRAVPVVHGDGE